MTFRFQAAAALSEASKAAFCHEQPSYLQGGSFKVLSQGRLRLSRPYPVNGNSYMSPPPPFLVQSGVQRLGSS